MMWDVHLTTRDSNGERKEESYGVFSVADLPHVLERVMRRAGELRAGVQVARHRHTLGAQVAPAAPD